MKHLKCLLPLLLVGFSAAETAQGAQTRELELGDGRVIVVRDAGFVQVQYNDEGFGLTIETELITRNEGAEETKRQVSQADLKRACEVVLKRPEARIGRHPPDYVFFQVVSRVVDAGLVRLRKTDSTFFETRTDRCRLIDGEPQEVK